MRVAAMSLTAAACGFVVFLLSAPAIQGKDVWRVTYPSPQICALKGSTVNISCSYTYPTTETPQTKIRYRFWFTKITDKLPVDLETDSDYTGRVEYNFHDVNDCTLRINDLRERDTAEYMFRFKINEHSYTGRPGVTLSVTDLQVQVERSSAQVVLRCRSQCNLSDRPSYVWYNNGRKMYEETASIRVSVNSSGQYSCAVKGHEQRSAAVYAPKFASVSMSPSEIVEGSSVILTCSSDANPAANYTWYKGNGNPGLSQSKQTQQVKPPRKLKWFVLSSIQSSDSGEYFCTAENNLGSWTPKSISINVEYAPRLPSVSVSPSEIVEGSSVNLTCSSDANPAANYTWYKENEDSPKASGQIFTITDFRAEHSGNYYCEAQNSRGRRNSTLHLIVVAGNSLTIMNIIRLSVVVLMPIPLLLLTLLMRKKKTLSCTTEPHDPVEIELDSCSAYESISDTAAQTEDSEEQEELV